MWKTLSIEVLPVIYSAWQQNCIYVFMKKNISKKKEKTNLKMKKKFNLIIIVWMVLVSSCLFSRDSQQQREENFAWVNLGIGLGSSIYYDTDQSLATTASLTFQDGRKISSFRVATCTAIMDAGISEIGILNGRVINSSGPLIALSAGIALVHYTDGGGSSKTIGIPLEIQIFAKKTRHTGFYGFANINPNRIFFGICLCLRIGKLKK